MLLSVWEHYIRFAIKCILLKYIIYFISTLFKSMLTSTCFSQGLYLHLMDVSIEVLSVWSYNHML